MMQSTTKGIKPGLCKAKKLTYIYTKNGQKPKAKKPGKMNTEKPGLKISCPIIFVPQIYGTFLVDHTPVNLLH